MTDQVEQIAIKTADGLQVIEDFQVTTVCKPRITPGK